MKNRILLFFAAVALLGVSAPIWTFANVVPISLSPMVSAYESDATQVHPIAVTIDGNIFQPNIKPILRNEVAFISARDFCNLSGISMAWSGERKEVIVTNGKISAVFKIGSTSVLIGTRLLALPEAPFVMNGTSMLPAEYLGNVFGFSASWDTASNQITFRSPMTLASPTDSAVTLLDYDSAIKAGVLKSSDYRSSVLYKNRIKSQNDELIIPSGTYNLQLLQAKMDLVMYKNWADKQILIAMEQIGNSVKNQMDDLSLLFVEKKNQQDKIDLMTEKLRIEKISYDYGLRSFQSFLTMQTNYNTEVQNLTILEQKINAAYTKLNQTLGNPADYRNDLEYDVKYEPIGNVKLEYKIIDDTARDPFIWFANQNVDSKEFALSTYEWRMGGQSWTLTSMDLTEARKNLNDTKTALAGVIRDRYNSLIQLEEQIRLLELTLEQAKDSVNSIRLQYDLGNAIKLQVEEAQMAIPGLEYQIQGLKQQHEQLKMLFEKPYLAPTYVSGA